MVRIVQPYREDLARTLDRGKQGRTANRRDRAPRNSFRKRPLYLLPAIDNANRVGRGFGEEIAERNDRIVDHYARCWGSVVRRKTHQLHGLFLSNISAL